MKEVLKNSIKNKTSLMGVIGLGYVGLPLAVEMAKAGYTTIGVDVQKNRTEMLNRGENYIADVSTEDVKRLVENGKFMATTDFSHIENMDFIAICVPTPLDRHKQPDIHYIEEAGKGVGEYLSPQTLVVLESTTYPGTTEEVLLPLLEKKSGLLCGKDFYLAFSPERVDPGNKMYTTKNTPKVVGGVDEDATELATLVYRQVLEGSIHTVSSPRVAELEKLLENTYRNVNIGLVNEFTLLAEKMNIDMWEVVDAAKTKPYGFQAFYPGPGVGGHCIPLDPFYLTWKAKEYDMQMTIIEASGKINESMPEYVVQRLMRALSRRQKKALCGAKILVLGMAYKKDIDDLRDSPALLIYEFLAKEGAEISYYDSYIPSFKRKDGKTEYSIKALDKTSLEDKDAVLITTDHSKVDYAMVAKYAKFVFDTKNVTKDMENENIERL